MAVVLMVGPMRDVLRWQRELNDTISETNVHLVALTELRDVLNRQESARQGARVEHEA